MSVAATGERAGGGDGRSRRTTKVTARLHHDVAALAAADDDREVACADHIGRAWSGVASNVSLLSRRRTSVGSCENALLRAARTRHATADRCVRARLAPPPARDQRRRQRGRRGEREGGRVSSVVALARGRAVVVRCVVVAPIPLEPRRVWECVASEETRVQELSRARDRRPLPPVAPQRARRGALFLASHAFHNAVTQTTTPPRPLPSSPPVMMQAEQPCR